MSKHLVFVYGTLRRGNAGAMSIRFPGATFIANAKVNGRLYDLGAYPGLLPGDSDSLVVGEVYEVDDETLNELDAFEASSNYFRKLTEVSLGADKTNCWTYEPDPETYSLLNLITSGDWIDYARKKPAGESSE